MGQLSTPDWVKDAVFYQIFPDRFAKSASLAKPSNLEPWDSPPTRHGFKGGDLAGVVERLDYLADLGVTALYLNPVFQSSANHRYHTYDYYRVDPLLGGNDALRRLLDEAHRRDMRVVLDGVFNHASRGFFQFHDLLENGAASPYRDWFVAKSFPLNAYDESRPPNYEAWWNLHPLPKFNIDNAVVREFLLGVAEHWIAFGADGWRLDVPEEINHGEFWREFRRRVKARNPDAYLVGEIWHEAPEWLRGDRLDGVMNYPLAKACLGAFPADHVDDALVRGVGYAPIPQLTARAFLDEATRLASLYDVEATHASLNSLGTHDTPRFLTLAGGDATALKMAVLFLSTFPGAPCLYYGDEVGMLGGRDPDCRRSFHWDEASWDRDLRGFVKACIALRRERPALRRGAFTPLFADDHVFAYARRHANDVAVVAFNLSREAQRQALGVGELLAYGLRLRDAWSGERAQVVGGVLRTGPSSEVEFAPRSWRVWVGEAG